MNKKTQSGFSTLFILFLLPVLVALIIATVFSQKIIHAYTTQQALCRTKLLETQKILAKHLLHILELNPMAQKFRFQEKMLLIAIAGASAAANPILLKKLLVDLEKNRVQQKILRIQMEGLQLKAQSMAAAHILKTSPHIAVSQPPILHLEKKPAHAIAPDFLPTPHFEQKQVLTARWSLKIHNLFQKWISMKDFSGSCSATLIRKENAWTPNLSVAKYSLNAFLL